VLERSFQKVDHWGTPDAMTKALTEVRRAFDSASVEADARSSILALTKFKQTGRFANFIELKYGCFGVGLPIMIGRKEWSVIGDEPMLRQLLKQVDEEKKQPRRFRKCYQGLMHSYFSYPVLDEDSNETVSNWKILQRFLGNRREVASSASNMPTWLATLGNHANLLTSSPCEVYAADLLKGNNKRLVNATEGIGIGAGSWVWQEAIITTFETVTVIRDDGDFRDRLNSLLDMLDEDSDTTLSESVRVKCIAMLLVRYVKCTEKPEHPRLRDLAVHHIGNPWLKRASWDAYVKNDGARKMVDGWLKRRLITDFFALLSEDGAANPRRLEYWLRFEPVIEDLWFVLGANARYNKSAEFTEMKRRMQGRLHYLGSGTTADNNAFIMRIGSFMVVEFGMTGNACFVFNANDLLIAPLQKTLPISTLKGSHHVERLLHSGPWESNFDAWLRPRINWQPATLPPTALIANQKRNPSWPEKSDELIKFANSYRLPFIDKRVLEGALWVITDDRDPVVVRKLKEMGFRYTSGKGWWKR
jgi:hypothetical protein